MDRPTEQPWDQHEEMNFWAICMAWRRQKKYNNWDWPYNQRTLSLTSQKPIRSVEELKRKKETLYKRKRRQCPDGWDENDFGFPFKQYTSTDNDSTIMSMMNNLDLTIDGPPTPNDGQPLDGRGNGGENVDPQRLPPPPHHHHHLQQQQQQEQQQQLQPQPEVRLDQAPLENRQQVWNPHNYQPRFDQASMHSHFRSHALGQGHNEMNADILGQVQVDGFRQLEYGFDTADFQNELMAQNQRIVATSMQNTQNRRHDLWNQYINAARAASPHAAGVQLPLPAGSATTTTTPVADRRGAPGFGQQMGLPPPSHPRFGGSQTPGGVSGGRAPNSNHAVSASRGGGYGMMGTTAPHVHGGSGTSAASLSGLRSATSSAGGMMGMAPPNMHGASTMGMRSPHGGLTMGQQTPNGGGTGPHRSSRYEQEDLFSLSSPGSTGDFSSPPAAHVHVSGHESSGVSHAATPIGGTGTMMGMGPGGMGMSAHPGGSGTMEMHRYGSGNPPTATTTTPAAASTSGGHHSTGRNNSSANLASFASMTLTDDTNGEISPEKDAVYQQVQRERMQAANNHGDGKWPGDLLTAPVAKPKGIPPPYMDDPKFLDRLRSVVESTNLYADDLMNSADRPTLFWIQVSDRIEASDSTYYKNGLTAPWCMWKYKSAFGN